MKPRLHNRVLARFPAVLAQTGGVALVSAVSVACAPLLHAPLEFMSVAAFVTAIAASYALGALVSLAFLGRLLYPVVAKLAGAPFSVGDWVVILRGARFGAIAQIYEVWSERGQMRLRLSEEKRQAVADVYSYHEVLRAKEPNKSPEPTPTAVTPRASEMKSEGKNSICESTEARVAPAAVVAHL